MDGSLALRQPPQWGSAKVGLRAPRKGFPTEGPLPEGWMGDSRGGQVHSREGLHFSVKHAAILASASREEVRHLYSGGKAARLIFLLDKGLHLKEQKDWFCSPFPLFSLWVGVSVAQWEWAIQPGSCFSPKQQLLGAQVCAQWSSDLRGLQVTWRTC